MVIRQHAADVFFVDLVETGVVGYQLPVQQALAQGDGLVAFQVFQVITDVGAGLGGDREVQPRGVRVRARRRDDLDGLPGGDTGAERRQPAIDPDADATVADTG